MMAFLVFDDNNEKFSIPNGETAIGRGPYLRVKELSLSRSHALLSFNNGKLSIKPNHKNPTYFYSSTDDEQQVQLKRDEWTDLADGDQISLLSDSFKYRIEIDLQKSIEENNDLSDDCKKDLGIMMDETQPIESIDKENEPSLLNNSVTSSQQNITSPNRKRKLPAWMTATKLVNTKKKTPAVRKMPAKPKEPTKKEKDKANEDKTKGTTKSPVKKKGKSIATEGVTDSIDPCEKAFNGETNSQIETSPKHTTTYTSQTAGVQPTDPWEEKDDDQGSNNSFSMLDDPEEPVKCDVDVPQNEDEDSRNSFSMLNEDDNEDHGNQEKDNVLDLNECSNDSALMLDQENHQSESTEKGSNPVDEDCNSNQSFSMLNDENETVETKAGEDDDPLTADSAVQGSSTTLKPCPYGKRCYRKNPVHFTEFSHNTDDEDNNDNDEDETGKTECPYGLKCYRQGNPHHTSQYTHTSIGKERRARNTRKQRTKKKKSLLDNDSDNEGDNEYDMNDSFLASSDESSGYSDNDSDSDYKPHGKDDDDDEEEESEDVNELLAEAKGFIKNKKM